MSLVLDNPVQPILELPPAPDLWQQSAAIAHSQVRWRIYLHQIGAAALLAWFTEEFAATQSAAQSAAQSAQLWPNAAPLDIWHVVDGLALTLGDKRIVVMLSEAMDAAEMQVPQEWVDLPGWAAHYYIAAQVDVDTQQLALWGYAPGHTLKNKGRYDADARTYCLTEDDLIQDFSAFWVAQQMESLETLEAAFGATEQLPDLLPAQVDNLIPRLAAALEPRLEIPFAMWGALLSNGRWRSRLYQQRQGDRSLQTTLANAPANLGQWANRLLSQGWESLDSLGLQLPASSFRSNQVSTNQPSPTAATATTGGKVVVLNAASDPVELVLAISVSTEADERRNIRIRLYPAHADDASLSASVPVSDVGSEDFPSEDSTTTETVLPSGVTLTLLLTETEQVLQAVRAGDHDNYIQLPPFRCPAGEAFSVRIQLAGAQSAEPQSAEPQTGSTGEFVQEDFVS